MTPVPSDLEGAKPALRAARRSGTLPPTLLFDHATPELLERELIKMSHLATAMAAGLRDRGVPDPDAALAAEAGIAVFRVAFERWTTDPHGQDLRQLLRDALAELKSVTA